MIHKTIATLGLLIVLLLSACSSAAPVTAADLNGTWASTSTDGPTFEATISDNLIEMNLVNGDTKALYWKGTFPVPETVTEGTVITSAADTEALSSSMLGSQDPSKNFTHTGGKLKFDFSALGVTKTVELSPK